MTMQELLRYEYDRMNDYLADFNNIVWKTRGVTLRHYYIDAQGKQATQPVADFTKQDGGFVLKKIYDKVLYEYYTNVYQ